MEMRFRLPVCYFCNKSNLFNKKEIEIFRVKESLADTNRNPHRICNVCLEKYEKKNNVRLTVLGVYTYKSKKFEAFPKPPKGFHRINNWNSQIRFLQRKDREQRRLLK